MIQSIGRAVAVALLGALIGPACLVVAYGLSPETKLPIDRLAPIAAGFFAAERDGDRWFVWTAPRATMTLNGLDRRAAWSCSVRFRGARPASVPQADVTVAVDGLYGTPRPVTNEVQEVTVTAPERPLAPGLTLSIVTSTPFLPGGDDPRALGVQVEGLGCRPVAGSIVLPPRRTLRAAAVSAAVFGAGLGLTGITAGSAVGAVALIAAGQAWPLSTGAAPYGKYPTTLVWLAAWLALLMVVAVKAIEAWNRQALRNTARFVFVFSAGAVFLKLLALLHPSKAIVDAVFHAHRFESVLAGRYYFTQLSTSATPFPYAIGLYLFAIPWSVLTHDHVALLRVVVCAADAVAGGLLYLMVVRTSGDRLAGAIAVALFSLVPITYVIVGYANLTNAFGASVALVTLAAVTLTSLRPRHVLPFVLVVALATLGLISHISTFLLLLATLAALVCLYFTGRDAELRVRATGLAIAAAVALILSVVLYWGHFGDVYRTQWARVRRQAPVAGAVSARTAATVQVSREAVQPAQPRPERTRVPLAGRMADAGSQTVKNVGWPILVLAVVGLWRLWTTRSRDRVALAIAAWAVVCIGFVAASVLAPTDARYQQDAGEFIARVEQMTCPAAVLLAAFGAAWAWRRGTILRLASAALMLAAFIVAVRVWTTWLY